MKIKIFPTGWSVFFYKLPCAMYSVILRDISDHLIDKIGFAIVRLWAILCGVAEKQLYGNTMLRKNHWVETHEN